jgi:hypothetical protein
MVITSDPLSLSYYSHVTSKFQAYTLLILDWIYPSYRYSIPLSDKVKEITVQLQIQTEILVLIMDLS